MVVSRLGASGEGEFEGLYKSLPYSFKILELISAFDFPEYFKRLSISVTIFYAAPLMPMAIDTFF